MNDFPASQGLAVAGRASDGPGWGEEHARARERTRTLPARQEVLELLDLVAWPLLARLWTPPDVHERFVLVKDHEGGAGRRAGRDGP